MRAPSRRRASGVDQMVLLSAICVQKPLLAFQQAKLAFERQLMEFGLDWSIVRPTAFFKSLSGQVERVRGGKPFLVFGDGELTACKPISDDDLVTHPADCLDDETRRNRILPIGGPGPAITPREQGERLFELTGKPPRFRHVPVAMLDVIAGALGALGRHPRWPPRPTWRGSALLRHRIHAGPRPGDRPLRGRRHAFFRDRDALRLLRASGCGGGGGRTRRPRGVLKSADAERRTGWWNYVRQSPNITSNWEGGHCVWISSDTTRMPPSRRACGPPRTQDVAASLIELIGREGIGPGERLPPEIESARRLGVGRSTIRETLRAWQDTGIVTRNKGAGTTLMVDVTVPQDA